MGIKLWIDDIRPAPDGYALVKSVNTAKIVIKLKERQHQPIELIDIDHDAGDYVSWGGDYIELLNWLEETGRNYPIRIHSMNVVGRQNMEAICRKNGWKIVY